MTVRHVLVAVDDSPAALRAAGVAFDLAAGWHAQVRLVTVVADATLGALLDATVPDGGAGSRIEEAGRALLHHLSTAARTRGLDVEPVQLLGDPFRAILEQARSWPADVVVMGRGARRGPGSPYLGSVTARVLEFAECPVLVVPNVPALA